MAPAAIAILSVGLVPVVAAKCIIPPDWLSTAPLFKVIFPVEVMVPPGIASVPAAVIPANVQVPAFTVNVPFALTVNKAVTVNVPPVVTVIDAPLPVLLIFTVAMVTALLMMG